MSRLKMVLHGYLSLVYLDRECTLKVHCLDDNAWDDGNRLGIQFYEN